VSAARAEAPATIILSGPEVAALMAEADWLAAVETGFRAAAAGQASAPPPMTLPGIGGAFHAKGAALWDGRPFVALKLNGNFPGNPEARGVPTIQGAILLCDGETGCLLALMDSIEVTLRRTAAATALAARYLARRDSTTITICGCGAQGQAQLDALRALLPLRRLIAWDRDRARARAFADAARGAGMAAEAVDELPRGGGGSDVVVTCTTSEEPFLTPDLVARGTFVAAVGADSPTKSEIDPALFRGALAVVDVLEQCAAMGDLRHALAAGAIGLGEVHAELGELVSGTKPGRTSAEQITLFDSTGTGLQDVACAAMIYERTAGREDVLTFRLGARP
jgi:ornithine cyclodeaminase/alanine dehydrogenase-like protein (mu-crystallin family)